MPNWRSVFVILCLLVVIGQRSPVAAADDMLWANTLPGQSVNTVALDPSDEQIVYAAGPGGLHKSADGGLTWALVSGRPLGHQLLVDPRAPETLFATASSFSPDYENQLLESTSGGTTWQVVQTVAGRVSALLADPNRPGALYATVSGSGVDLALRSLDGGGSWTRINDRLLGFGSIGGVSGTSLAMVKGVPDLLYVGTSLYHFNVIMETRDASALPRPQLVDSPGKDNEFAAPTFLGSVSGSAGYTVYTLWSYGPMTVFVQRSRNDGPWETIPSHFPYLQGQDWVPFITATALDPRHPERLYAAFERHPSPLAKGWFSPPPRDSLEHGVFVSRDGGATWAALPPLDTAVNGLALATGTWTLYAATERGIFRLVVPPEVSEEVAVMPDTGGGGAGGPSSRVGLAALAALVATLTASGAVVVRPSRGRRRPSVTRTPCRRRLPRTRRTPTRATNV